MTKGPASAGSAAIAEKERPVSDVTMPGDEGERSYESREFAGSAAPAAAAGSFFDMYKPGQGYYTRVWSGVASSAMILWGAYFLYEKLDLLGTGATARYFQVGIPTAAIIVLGLLAYWALARNRRVCDFLIATEGEMKKVNWTSRKEIIGSTKVVVFVVVSMSVLLFVIDVFFMVFFSAIGVLKGEGLLSILKGGG